jgi:predicted DNA-binding transcriptional regulator AlpA
MKTHYDQTSAGPAPGFSASTAPDLIALRKFLGDAGVHPCTGWRWIKRGWLPKPLNISGRLYLSREQVVEFMRRAAAGEFAVNLRPPAPIRKI